MTLRFFLKLFGFDFSKPLEVIHKVLNLVGRSPLKRELVRVLTRATPAEQALIALDLSAAGTALSQGDREKAVDQLTDILFSIQL